MNEIIREIEAAQLKAEVPAFETGDTVRVYGKIKEGNRERVQVFEGVVLKETGRQQPCNLYRKKELQRCRR